MPPIKVPKSKLKKGIKRRQKNTKALSANVHIMVWLDYLLNLTRLSQQAGDKAREEKTAIINPTHVKAVTKVEATSFKELISIGVLLNGPGRKRDGYYSVIQCTRAAKAERNWEAYAVCFRCGSHKLCFPAGRNFLLMKKPDS